MSDIAWKHRPNLDTVKKGSWKGEIISYEASTDSPRCKLKWLQAIKTVPIIISVVYGSKALAQKLTSNTELTRFHNVKNLFQHTALNISLRKSRLLLATSRSISLRKMVIPSEAISHRKTVVPSKTNLLFASANPDMAGIKRKIIRRGESE